MIYFYSGTPGSGKSLHVAKDIVNKLTVKKQNVISNIKIDLEGVRSVSLFKPKVESMGKFFFIDNTVEPSYFYKYAEEHHVKGVEGQTLIVFDEAQMLFSPTVIKLKQQEDKTFRAKWLEFFTQHRHLGFNIIIISQFDRLIDPQIRCLFEYNIIHRKVNNFKIGWICSLLKISVFCAINYWYGVKERMGCEFYLYQKKYSKIYDSYKLFDEKIKSDKNFNDLVNTQMQSE